MSDVPVGVFLSGGLDSSGLAGLMASKVAGRLHTFSVGFEERDANEFPYARMAATAIGAQHHEVVVSSRQFFATLPRLVWHEDEPIAFPSSVPLYFVSELAREHVKVVLTGEGADELFLGYNRYRVTAWNERLGSVYSQVLPQRLRDKVGGLVNRLPSGARRYATRSFLALRQNPRTLFFENFAVFGDVLRERVLTPDAHAAPLDPYAEGLRYYRETPGSMLQRMSAVDLQTYLVELLMKQDQMSMAASIESRVPFLDHLLVEHVVRLPERLKLRGWQTKAVLRQALRDVVPHAILTRRKMGFPVPVGQWLHGAFWPLVEDLVLNGRAMDRGLFDASALRALAHEHRAGHANHGDRLWLLANLEIWHRVFIDGEDIAAVKAAA
jgi:asparagine synthase (glutamine-hydrolysing)